MLLRAGDHCRIQCRLVHFEQRRFFRKEGFADFKKSSIFLFFGSAIKVRRVTMNYKKILNAFFLLPSVYGETVIY